MISFIQKRLEFKIIIALIFVLGLVIGAFTLIDIRIMRADTIQSSEKNLQTIAGAVKSGIIVAMRKGHQDEVQQILDGVKAPATIDRIIIYDEHGKALRTAGGLPPEFSSDDKIPDSVIRQASRGDKTETYERAGLRYLSYYTPIPNQPECFRCHAQNIGVNGILRMDFSLQPLERHIALRRDRIILWTISMIVTLMAALVALLRILVYRPVRELGKAMVNAEAAAGGVALPIRGTDELADLKRGFIAMLGKMNALYTINIEKEKELARNQEVMRFRTELQAMFDAMPDGVLLVDTEFRIVQGNPRAFALLPGLKKITGAIPLERMQENSCPHHGLQTAMKEGKICEHQCSVKLPDGDVRHVHIICAPIKKGGRVVYMVEVIRDITERVKTEHELEDKTSELLAANKLLSQIAVTDSLTQLYNRRHFDEIFLKEIKLFSRRKYASLSLMMIDIDHFKKLNDKHGHLMGDMVLREIAKLLQEGVRGTDTIARYGGEEFVIVMPDTRIDGAEYKAEMLRQRVMETEFHGQSGPIHVTISIGVASFLSGAPNELIYAADQALYQAKHSGRNRVVVDKRKEAIV